MKIRILILLLLAVAGVILAQDADFIWFMGQPGFQGGWEGLIDTLTGKNGWPAAAIGLIGLVKLSVRIIRKVWEIIRAKTQAEVSSSTGHVIVEVVEKTMAYRWLTGLAWLVDAVTSIPLAQSVKQPQIVVVAPQPAGTVDNLPPTPPPDLMPKKAEAIRDSLIKRIASSRDQSR